MKVALIELEPRRILEVFNGVPPMVRLPGVGSVSPVEIGWRGGGEISYERHDDGRETAIEGPARFEIVAVSESDPPPAGHRVASIVHRLVGNVVIESAKYEAIEDQAEPTAEEKLARSGLTVDELKSLLGLAR